jgi:A/G-specific adenine glycosylase
MRKHQTIADRLLAWCDRHGRKDLPWQEPRDPYRVWVSEIMLQQTQVATVIPYFERFMARFPDVAALAKADIDEVLHLWTGLGYYARARNLHKAARRIVAEHGGRFPTDFEAVAALPGIGRSTAGAVLALACDQRHPILDGNVKRVLTRHFRIAGWPGETKVEKRLWETADALTPTERVADYTQAIMDLGATVCRRTRPDCGACPLEGSCAARRAGDVDAYPAPRPRKRLPERATLMLLIRNEAGEVLLTRRPPTGIWGGLWSLPECAPGADIRAYGRRTLGLDLAPGQSWDTLRHTFSHFHLDITPVPAQVLGTRPAVLESAPSVWYNPDSPDARGLAAPVKRLLERLRNDE